MWGGEIPGGKIPMITVYLTRHLEPASGVINSPLSRLDSSAREPSSPHSLLLHRKPDTSQVLPDHRAHSQTLLLAFSDSLRAIHSSKQGLPGRVGGGQGATVRSTAGASQTVTSAGVAKQNAAARAYGVPQTNR